MEAEAPARLVVLAIDTGPEARPGPIRSQVRCEADFDLLCVPTSGKLAEAVLLCGPVQVTIDHSLSHRQFVHFPSALNDPPSEGMPSDLEIVRCVQSRVGFSFSAGIATGASALIENDPRPFEGLHARGD